MDMERRLRETLDARATEALGHVPHGMPPDVRRRARRRQAWLALVGGIVAAALLFAGMTAAGVVTIDGAPHPAGPPSGRRQDGGRSQETRLPSMERTNLGTGISEGLRWTLFVYRQDSLWCLGIAAGALEQSSCPFGRDDPLAVRGMDPNTVTSWQPKAARAGDPKLVYGTVSDAVATVEASTGGRRLRVRIVDVPPGVEPPFDRAFVIAVDRDTTVLVTAYDERGEEILSAGA